jgi:hypothetical protein
MAADDDEAVIARPQASDQVFTGSRPSFGDEQSLRHRSPRGINALGIEA